MITILRLGHRCARDKRISTHVGLTARALGAGKIIYSGEPDGKLIESVKDISDRFGGLFEVTYEKNWKKIIQNFQGCKIHLTAYGVPVQDKISDIRRINDDFLVIVGGEKVPPIVYEEADFNIAVANQPHSEVAALAIFLHELQEGKELSKEFKNSKIRIRPNPKGKTVEND